MKILALMVGLMRLYDDLW